MSFILILTITPIIIKIDNPKDAINRILLLKTPIMQPTPPNNSKMPTNTLNSDNPYLKNSLIKKSLTKQAKPKKTNDIPEIIDETDRK